MKKIVALLSMLFISIGCIAEDNNISYSRVITAGVYEKKLYTGAGNITFDMNKRSLQRGHVVLPLLDCGDSDWSCTSYMRFIFAYKKNWTELPSTWEFETELYEYRGLLKISLLGSKENVLNIVIQNKRNKSEYTVLLYSKEKGLLAFLENVVDEDTNEEFQELYILEGEKGLMLM